LLLYILLAARGLQVVYIADPVLLAEAHELERAGAIDKFDLPRDGIRLTEPNVFLEKTSHPWWKVVRKVTNKGLPQLSIPTPALSILTCMEAALA
jgi:hypothetical protein